MKIDFIVSSLFSGGAERVLVLIANNLAKNKKFDIRVITWFSGEDNYTLSSSITRIVLDQNKKIPSHTLRSFINLSQYYRKKNNRPQIIISFLTLTNLITILVAKLYSIKIIAQEHNSHLRYMKGRKWITKLTKSHVYRKADVLTVLTEFDIDFYRKKGANVRVLPNPCSFKPIKDNSHTRNKIILAVGNLNRFHHKGFDNLLKLIAPILHDYPEWNLKIAGPDNGGLDYLNKLVVKYDLAGRVIFTGFLKNVSKLMHESSIFILPSRFEGLPMVLLEAMSQGMACIAYNCKTGPSEIIENEVNGLLIDDQNLKKMQEGLTRLLNNEGLRENLSYNALKSIDKFDINVITEQYELLFNEIINQ